MNKKISVLLYQFNREDLETGPEGIFISVSCTANSIFTEVPNHLQKIPSSKN